MAKDRVIQLRLPSMSVGQILDGLNVLVDDWDATEQFMEHGVIDDDRIIRECSSALEARKIAAFYREIIDSIEGAARVGSIESAQVAGAVLL